MTDARTGAADQMVRDRIVSEFDRNFLVEAGAGSGKTYSLAMRMASGIERGTYRVEEMAAVTFTRKAAAELRGRFQLALEERLRAEPGAAERERLERALAAIERLFAGTIHAFCAHLLRERPVDAGIAPGFTELGDADDERMRREAWRDFVVAARAEGREDLLDLIDAGIKLKELEEPFGVVCQHEDVEFDLGDGKVPDPKRVWKKVDAFWADLRALKPPAFHAETTCFIQQHFEEFEGRLTVTRPKRDRLSALAGFLQVWGSKPKLTQMYWAKEVGQPVERGKQVKALVDAFFADVIEPFMTDYRAYVHRLSMSVLIAARAHYAAFRRRQSLVNYVDLLGVTARMLRERAAVRQALQAKYRWLFIDEFQDTDPIQAGIFLMLAGDEAAAEAGAPGAVDPFALPLRPGALFVVGDPKQSIFRFRRADIDIYNRVRGRIEASGGERLSLTANFRSRPGVCALANTVFPPLFGALAKPYSPEFESLQPVRPDEEGGPSLCVATLTIDDAGSLGEQAAREAEAIAACIKSAVTSGRRGYGDFLILTRMRPRLSVFVQACDRLEIPVEVSGAGFFCKSPHVMALAGLLSALADPLDSVSLVGVLRGPLFGLSDPELFRFRQAGGRFELNVPLPEAATQKEAAALNGQYGPALGAMRRLQELMRHTWTLPLGAAVDRMLEETGWLALASTSPGGAEAGHLLQAVDRAREVFEGGGGLVEASAALVGDDSSESEALPLEPGRRNVVRLMNLHKAKGLEAPVVFLADAQADFTFPIRLRVERTGDRAVGHMRVARTGRYPSQVIRIGEPRGWAALEEEEKKYVDAERLRLLYVAGTRAKDLLVVCRSSKATNNKSWSEFEGFLAGAPRVEVPEVDLPAKVAKGRLSVRTRVAAAGERVRTRQRLCEASWAVTSVTGGKAEGEKARGGRAEGEGGRATAGLPAIADKAPAGAAWGALVHGLLEHAGRNVAGHGGDGLRAGGGAGLRAGDRDDLRRLARWLTVETPELRPFTEEAIDLVAGVLTTAAWKEARAGHDAHVEVPFAIRLERGESLAGIGPVELRTIVRGVIDLVYRAADGRRILDYKTDVDTSPEALARHAPQLDAYRAAWQRATGETVAQAEVLSVRGTPS